MTQKKSALTDVLNIRVDEALSREIERIAQVEGLSASEVARKLLGYGVDVQRKVEASYLQLPYTFDREKEKSEGRVVIDAAWRYYTPKERWEMDQQEAEAMEYGR